jgi:hypothetical protein
MLRRVLVTSRGRIRLALRASSRVSFRLGLRGRLLQSHPLHCRLVRRCRQAAGEVCMPIEKSFALFLTERPAKAQTETHMSFSIVIRAVVHMPALPERGKSSHQPFYRLSVLHSA